MKNYKWAVETKVYNNGKIEYSKPVKVGWEVDSFAVTKEKYDYYLDVFLTKKEAQQRFDKTMFA
jgi:hypothetical protein